MESQVTIYNCYKKVIEYANKKCGLIISKKFTKGEAVSYCINYVKEVEQCKAGDEEIINKIVDVMLNKLTSRGLLKFDGQSYKAKQIISVSESWGMYDTIPVMEKAPAAEEVDKQETLKKEYIGMQDYEEFDYAKFGAMLKQNGLLPPSYDRKPISVEIGLNSACYPRVVMVFKSKTTDSYRIVKASQHNAYEFVNGSYEGTGNEKLEQVWFDFMKASMQKLNFDEEFEINKKVYQMARQTEKIGKLKNIQQIENEFIDQNIDAKFFELIDSDAPYFVKAIMQSDYSIVDECVTPPTPKALELCVYRLDHDTLLEEAEDLDWFRKKCEGIRDASVYQSEKWDKVINDAVSYLKYYKEQEKSYQKYHGDEAGSEE